MNTKNPNKKMIMVQTSKYPPKWDANVFIDHQHVGWAHGKSFLRYDKLILAEKKPEELTLKEKIGKRLFGGRYFHPNVEDIVRVYEKRHGVHFKASTKRNHTA